MKTRTVLVMNEAAGSAGTSGALARERALALGWEVHGLAKNEGSREVCELSEAGYDLIIAGGGDGTIREVVQGLTRARRRATLGVLPLGTGNDLARALRMPLDVEPALDVLASAHAEGRVRPLDVLELEHGGKTSICANSVNGGIAPLIREQMSSELKATLGPLAFVWGALGCLSKVTRWPIRYKVDGGPVREDTFVAFVAANGGSVGGGAVVAPVAKLDDGRFDLVVIHADASITELTIAAVQAKFGDLFKSECVEHVSAERLEIIEQPDDLTFTADGDLVEGSLRGIRVLPGALRAIVGPD